MAIEKGVSLAFIATLYICVIQRAGGATFQIENNCPFTVWAAGSPGGGKQLQKGQSWTLQVPADTGSGTFWGRTGCSFDGSGRGSCETGDCEGLNCTQLWGEVPVTRAVYYLQYPHYQNLDLYSISLLGGFNLPMSIIPSDSQCEAIACNRNITAFCPTELTISGGCKRDCVTFGSNSCNYSTYTEFFKSQCTQAHSSATDQDSSWTFHCPGGTDYRVVFCGGTDTSLQGHDTSLQGFQNIDCGGTSNHTGENNISWVTDDNYIDVGEKADTGNASLPFYLQRLRLFPKPLAKSCYRLPVAPSVPHLFRLWFCDGNNRSFQKWRSFAFSIETQGLLAVENVTITNLLPIYYEGILVSAGNVLHICLIRTFENDVPFINAIELRTLRDGMYRQAKPGTMLSLISRQDLGGISSIRYPEDNFDRIWTSDVNCSTALWYANWREFISSNNTENFPPTAVMQTAWVTNGDRFEFSIPTTYRAKSLLMLYFAEIETSNISGSRSFYVTINGETRSRTINVAMDYSAMELTFISNITDDFKFEIVKATNSTRRPILNAFEYYSLHDTYQATSSEDIEALDAIKKRIDRKDWISDPCYLMQWDGISCANTSSAIRISEINLSRRNLTGGIPENIGQLTAVVNVSLDNNNLVGQLPDFSNLTLLERLHLQNNNLSGSVPDWLCQLKNLKQLFIDNNNFSGTIPTQLLDKPSLNITYSGNHYLCMDKRTCQRISRKDKTSVVLGITISGTLILVLALTVGIAVYHKKFKTEQHHNEDNSMIMVPNPTKPHFLTLEEIVQATQNFSRKIGQGGFGSVFFGKLPEGNDIAVKVLSLFSREGVHQFQNEVDLLSKIHHKNLVSLLGYCNESRELMLIYEYMSHGSLKDHLYGSCAEVSQLNWKTRLQIALDAAQGLEYLHMGCNPKIIHRDIKAANILLDGNMKAKLADFGLSRITINGEASGVTTVVKGTIGYLDPEYYRSRRLTEKSDVYSFGVVLLEIICGRAPINENLPEDELNLIEWVTPYVEMDENLGDIAVIIDKRLGGNYEMKSVAGIVKLAFRCVEAKPFCRPNVTEVVAQIRDAIIQENENDVPLPNLERIGTEDEDVQTSLARSWVESRPKEMEWADNSSNLAQVGR